jgi:hypothetical protein
MNRKPQIALIPLLAAALFLQGCATTFTGKAEQSTQLAADVFNAFVTAERQLNPEPVSAAAKATPIHQYAEYIRKNGKNWLVSARALTEAYRLNPTSETKTALEQILAVIAAGLAQSQVYLAQTAHK